MGKGIFQLIIVFTLFLQNVTLHAVDSIDVKREKTKTVQKLIVDLGDNDPRIRSEAARNLGFYVYKESKDALFKTLTSEVRSNRPNSYVIQACIDSLSSMVNKTDAQSIQAIEHFLSAIDEEPWIDKVLKSMTLLHSAAMTNKMRGLPSLPIGETPQGFFELLKLFVTQGKINRDDLRTIMVGTENDISFEMAKLESDPKNPTIVGREKEADEVLQILVRIKSRIPVLVGRAGVGKTAVAQAIALQIFKSQLPDWFMYGDEFPKGTVVLQTSAARIGRLALSNTDNAQAAALEEYIDAIKRAQLETKAPVILYIDEMHTLTSGQQNALKTYAEQIDGIRIIGSTTHREFQLMIGHDPAMERRLTQVPISELSEEETFEVLKRGWIAQIEKRFHVKISDELLPELIQMAPEIYPDLARPDSPIKFIQDLAIRTSRKLLQGEEKDNHEWINVTEEMARNYVASITGVPINPRDTQALVRYIEDGRSQIKQRVIGQDHLVDLMTDTWMDVLTSGAERSWRSVTVIGTTGTGKTLTSEMIGEVFLKSREKILTVDCTAYSSGPHALNSLLGAPNGIISSDKTKGILPEFLSGVGKRTGVIIFNEFDKAHPDLAKKLMEMIDRGELTGGDGRTYFLNRHLIVFTTNRGANKIFNERLGHLLSSEELLNRVRRITESQARQFFSQSDTYAYLDEHRLPPEVVNRIDRWVVAKPITFEDALMISELKAVQVAEENLKIHKFVMKIDKKLLRAITEVAFVPSDGARPVEKKVESILSRCRALAWSMLSAITEGEIRVEFDRHNDGNSRVVVIDAKSNRELGSLPFEEPTRFMALNDPRFLETLLSLESNMKKEIFGQDEAISQVTAAVRAKANRPLDPTPLSLWLLGPTGVGKTETAKVLAKYLYGSPDRAQVLSFGKINHMFELNDIFGPPRGIIGSESKAMFETILESFPEGTVIVFDELSNMGRGALRNEKDSLFKRLYEIFGEGKWTNAHGKTYDLAKYTFVLTGNDGEEFFRGLPNDDLRQEIWEKNHDRETLKKLLLKAGIPEAFLNRMHGMILMRSLGGKSMENVISKFINRVTSELEAGHGVNIVYSDNFIHQVSRAFFPLSDGARGTQRFSEIELTAFIGDFLITNRETIQRSKNKNVAVDLHLNFPDQPWAVDKKVKPSATLTIRLDVDKKTTLKSEKTLKPFSAPRITTRDEAYRVSSHESGHALVNELLQRPLGPLRHLTIESAGNYGGYASYESEEVTEPTTLEQVIKMIAVLSAGKDGQMNVGLLKRDTGWKMDRKMINTLIYQTIVDFGLVQGLEFIPPGEKEQYDLSKLSPKVKSRITVLGQKLLEIGSLLSSVILSQSEVRTQQEQVIQLLIEKGSISPDEFLNAIGDFRLNPKRVDQLLDKAVSDFLKSSGRKKGCASSLEESR